MNRFLKLALSFMGVVGLYAQPNNNIRLNQVGFFVNGPKVAAVIGSAETAFTVKSVDRSIVYHTGTLSAASTWAQSGESVKTADFSSFNTPGSYVLEVPNLGYSYTFTIKDDAFVNLNRGLVKAFYFNRTSTALPQQYAGQWARSAGHPDNQLVVHPSAASAQRPAGTIISAPKGWYDAGDYNSYIVNSGISTYTLLLAYEQFSSYYDTLKLNIPETGNTLPDILDEIKWNLDWMLSMQDPNDGGVYAKKTNANFDLAVMPASATSTRYVVQKSTAAAFDFAAVMAVTYRVFKNHDPAYATQCLNAAKAAYAWGAANPSVGFIHPVPASGGHPSVNTGGYTDGNLGDEYEWDANELYIATKEDAYYNSGFKNANDYWMPAWPNVRTLGLFSLVYHRKNLTARAFADTANMKNKLLTLANNYADYQKTSSPYKIAMGQNGNNDFGWGSNGNAGNQGMILINAYLATKNEDYLRAALSNVDYLVGRNALGYSFVTGFGSRPVNDIHHRPSEADNVPTAVPGWLSGGPSPNTGDNCPVNNTTYRAISFADDRRCYTKNEVAINWNAPAAYITGATSLYRLFNSGTVTSVDDVRGSATTASVQVFPVPASESVALQLDAKANQTAEVQVYNAMGTQVFEASWNLQAGSNERQLSVRTLTQGVYSVKIKTADVQYTGKIVVE